VAFCEEVIDIVAFLYKSLFDIFSYFIATTTDAGSNCHNQLLDLGLGLFHECFNSITYDMVRGSFPSGVNHAYSLHRRVNYENRNTVSGSDNPKNFGGVYEHPIAI